MFVKKPWRSALSIRNRSLFEVYLFFIHPKTMIYIQFIYLFKSTAFIISLLESLSSKYDSISSIMWYFIFFDDIALNFIKNVCYHLCKYLIHHLCISGCYFLDRYSPIFCKIVNHSSMNLLLTLNFSIYFVSNQKYLFIHISFIH